MMGDAGLAAELVLRMDRDQEARAAVSSGGVTDEEGASCLIRQGR